MDKGEGCPGPTWGDSLTEEVDEESLSGTD